VPLYSVRAPHACLSHPCAPLPCVPHEYMFHKVVINSTTWAFGLSTTERWLTAGCLGGNHSFYIHSHGHSQGCGCMHVRFHVIFFIHCKCLSIRRPYQTIGITLHFLVLGVTQRAPPSMDTVGEQTRGPMLTDAQCRKIERDKTRVQKGNVQRKRLHVLNNPSKLAFRRWEEVPKPWHMPIAKNTLSGSTSTINSFRSGIERIGSQTKQISGSAHI
jgi:hypothetical protein